MRGKKTRVTVRAVSCDAKVIGSLVGGCAIEIKNLITGDILARGLHLGGSGDTETIMRRPRRRGEPVYATEGTAAFVAELELAEPAPVEITAKGPLAYPQAMQRAAKTTWLVPGEDIAGDGIVLELHGFIVDIMQPESIDVLHSNQRVPLQTSVRLL